MLSPLINTTEQAMIPIKSIINEGGTQMRAGLDQTTVAEYAEALTAGVTLPPIILFHDGESYWLADGFHRFAAWKRAFGVPGNPSQYLRPEIPAEVRAGNRRDAILFAAGANANHGLRRTNADKQRSVDVLLRDPEWSQWSNSEIARRCAVDEKTVRKMRSEMPVSSELPKIDTTRTVQRGDQTYQQNTANIGANRPAPRPLMTVLEIQWKVAAVYRDNYGDEDVLATCRDMRAGAQKRIGRFWQLCVEHINSNDYRHQDLVSAINNTANQLEDAFRLKNRTASLEPPAAAGIPQSTLHEGAGRTPPPALTLDELVEDLGGYLANMPAADLAAASKGTQNKALETALFCMQDMTYRTGDLYRALARLALQRGAPVAAAPAVGPELAATGWRDVTAEFHADYRASGWRIFRSDDIYRAEHPTIGWMQDTDVTFLSTQIVHRTRIAGLWVSQDSASAPAERLADLPVVATTGPVVFVPAPDSPPLPEWVNGPPADNNALPAEPAPAPAEPDPWAVALDHVGSKQSTVERLARAMQPWLREYKDGLGRDAAHIAEFGNPSHSNSVAWQDINRELERRGLTVREDTLKDAIRQAFAWFLTEAKSAQPPAPEPIRHPRHDDLSELKEIFRLTVKSLHEWSAITGEHVLILDAERGLRQLSIRTTTILEEYK